MMKWAMIFVMASLVASARALDSKSHEKQSSHEKLKSNLLFHSTNGLRGQEETSNVLVLSPTHSPTTSINPTKAPTVNPTDVPTYSKVPSSSPTVTMTPSIIPTVNPTNVPTYSKVPSESPTVTMTPSIIPTANPTGSPSESPIPSLSISPTNVPTESPTESPSNSPVPSSSPTVTMTPSNAPTESPTDSPTNSPVPSSSPTVTMTPTNMPSGSSDSPTDSPTSSPTQECTLIAKLGHPYDVPNDAPYKGYHYDWLEVSKYKYDDDDYYYEQYYDDAYYNEEYYEDYYDGTWCDSWTSAPWCEYENSVPGQTGAYIQNVDDDYYEDMDLLTKEKITTVNMVGTSYFSVYHWFNDQDYYIDDASWAGDHMMAAKLTIWNKTKKVMLNPQGGWSHPVDFNTPTHVDGNINPDYDGYFYIEVSCSSTCDCTVSAPIPFDYEQGV